ncbi:alcohol dehydrogenase catalytic domain-containing protein [Euzebya rosea]|uniref:alcohol dehydrogenase catalytic domain-containing protein n=1 Tax=Euzebya rosea TaxID=2052804 RepID=UPI000D3E1EFB|nr:alcohol dehydrogenase catalytic domain-containing protein [Euzebya rosea]
MRGVVFEEPGRVVVGEVPDPQVLEATDAVIQVTRAGLCGSDLHPWTGAEPAGSGVVCGHEATGQVVAVGDDVRTVAPGDDVIACFTTSCGRCGPCREGLTARCVHGQLFGWGPPDNPAGGLHGGQAELLRVPLADGTLVPRPTGISADAAVLLADNMPTAWYAARRAEVLPGTRVGVIGLGAVGLCAIAACRALGAAEVVAVDPVPSRRAAADRLGARTTTPDDAALADTGLDAVIEAAGPSAAQRLAASMLRPGGVVSIIAVQTAEAFGISPVTAYDRNLTIRAGRAPVRAVLEEVLPAIVDGRLQLPVEEVVTHPRLPLADAPDAYARFAAREEGMVKVTFAP